MRKGRLLGNGRARMNPDVSNVKAMHNPETENRLAAPRVEGREKWDPNA